MLNLPNFTSAREIQRNYRKLFDQVKETKKPLIVMKNNQPEVAIIDVKQLEEMEAIISVLQSREESKVGKSKILKGSLTALWHETQAD